MTSSHVRLFCILLLAAAGACASAATAPVLTPGVWTNIPIPVTMNGNPAGMMCIAYDPSHTTTLYVGIEGAIGGGFAAGNGLWKSTDGGSTWAIMGSGPDTNAGDNVSSYLDLPICVAIDPNDSNHLYATEGVRGSINGFWTSTDGGANWTRTYSYDLTTLAVDPTDFRHVLVGSHSTDNLGVLESKDAGVTWTLHPPAAGWSGGTNGLGFLYDPDSAQGDANTWLIQGDGAGIWRTADAGGHWTKVSDASLIHGSTDAGGMYYAKDGALYKAAGGLPVRSRDNGVTWTTLSQGLPNSGYHTVIGDRNNLYIMPSVPATNVGYFTSPETDGTTWTQMAGSPVPNRGALQMRFDPARRIVYAASWAAGLWALKVADPVVAPSNPPSVATAAAANPSPVTGITTTLIVLGADDGGEAALTYTWSTVGTPPAHVLFSPNGNHSAKQSTATFSKAGTYTLRATITDAGGQAAVSEVTVTVNQTETAIVVTPATANVVPGESRSFTAVANDQFGLAMASQPALTWSVSGGGAITSGGLFTAGGTNGRPFTVTASGGGHSGTASVTVSTTGDGLLGEYYDNIDLTNLKLTRIDPMVDFNWGSGSPDQRIDVDTFSVRWTGRVRAQHSETYTFTTTTDDGARLWVNGVQLVNSWNNAGSANGTIALTAGQLYDLRLEYNENGGGASAQLFWSSAATAQQIIPQSQLFSAVPNSSPPPSNPPTVATGASANPNPVTGTTTALSALGTDDGGEAALTYTWATTGTPPAAVTFTPNGTNAAKNATATFTKAGSYSLRVTITDAGAQSITSTVDVIVNQTVTTVAVTPATVTVAVNGTRAFAASAKDQFAVAMTVQPTFTWTVSGGGAISAAGLFTAGATAGGPFTVTASSGGHSGTASVTVSTVVVPAPTITGITPTTGATGTVVTITGTNLGGTTAVTFNGIPAVFTVNGAGTQITTSVPTGATSGAIAVTTPGGTATSATSFTANAAPAPGSSSGKCGGGGLAVLAGLLVLTAVQRLRSGRRARV